MANVKVGLRNLTIPQKLAKINAIVERMTGNANFPIPNPALEDITAKIKAVEKAHTAVSAVKQASQKQINLLNLTESELDALIIQLSSYVDNTAAGNEQIILSSGFDVVNKMSDSEPLYAPEDFTATTGDELGEVNLMWNKLKNVGKHTYKVFGKKYGVEEEFVLKAGTDHSKVDIKGLDVNTKYEFYVLAVKKKQQGPLSETVIVKSG